MKSLFFAACLSLLSLLASTHSAAPMGSEPDRAFLRSLSNHLESPRPYSLETAFLSVVQHANRISSYFPVAGLSHSAELEETENDAIIKLEEQVAELNLDPSTPTKVAHQELLGLALEKKYVPDLQRLLTYGSLQESDLEDAVKFVATMGYAEMMKTLLTDDRVLKIDLKGALQAACQFQHKTVASLLLAYPPIRNNIYLHYKALTIALNNENMEIAQMFFGPVDLLKFQSVISEKRERGQRIDISTKAIKVLMEVVKAQKKNEENSFFNKYLWWIYA